MYAQINAHTHTSPTATRTHRQTGTHTDITQIVEL